MKSPKATAPERGFARNAADEKRLKLAGVRLVYRNDKPSEEWGKWRMRQGELLGVVDGLRAFGDNPGPINDAIKLVRSWGAAVIDVETGLRSDLDGVEMLHAALLPRFMTPDFLAEMQKKSVTARTEGRMSESKARRIWFDGRYSVAEKLALMTKWSRRAAYAKFGKTDAGPGRRTR